jgi:hypothetical protein
MTTTFTVEIEENLGPIMRRKVESDLEEVIAKRNYSLYDCSSEVDGDDEDE